MTRWPIAFLLGALALVAWLALSGERTPRAAEPTRAVAPAENSSPGEPAMAEVARAAQQEPAAERVGIRPAPENVAAGATIELLVIRKADRLPVAGAELWVLDRDRAPHVPPDLGAAFRGGWDREAWVRRHGDAYRTDAAGRARIRAASAADLVARHGTLYGIGAITTANAGRLTIELEPDCTLRLRAIDPEGNPVADLALWLRCWHRHREQLLLDQISTGWTDAGGRLTIHHAQLSLGAIAEDLATGRPTVQILAAAPGFDDAVLASFDSEAWPREELLVPVPATGAIVVELRGDPKRQQHARLHLAGELDASRSFVERFGSDRRARFPHVPLGRRYRASLQNRERVACELAGPVHPGQTVECVLEPEPPLELRCRLVDERAQPLANVAATLRLRFETGGASHANLMTTADGRGACLLPDAFRERRCRSIEFEVRHGRNGLPLAARIDPDRELRSGIVDLGEVRLEPPALLATGQAIGVDAKSLYAATLFVETLAATQADAAPRWQALPGTVVRWSAGGRFELRGTTDAARLRLTLAARGFAPCAPVEFAPGDRGLRVAWKASGAIEQYLLVDEGIDSAEIRASIAALDGQQLPGTSVSETWSGDRRTVMLRDPGEFTARPMPEQPGFRQWSGLLPGRYRLELRLEFTGQMLAAPLDLVVRAGETTRAPDVDLRGRLQRIRIELQDASGARLTSDAAAAVLLRDPVQTCGEPVSAGLLDLLVAGPVDLTVVASGFQRVDLDRVHSDRVVRLQRGPRIRVQFDLSSLELPALVHCSASIAGVGSSRIQVRTSKRAGSLASLPAMQPSGPVPIGAERCVAWQLAGGGEYRLFVQRNDDTSALVTEPETIRVTDAPEQEFHVRVRRR